MGASRKTLTHVDGGGRPRMVDVSAKGISSRRAVASCLVVFPGEVARQLVAAGMRGTKGPVLETAIIAGVMAAKRTHELIPFCHPLALEDCQVRITWEGRHALRIDCEVAVSGKTGVEMEALTGATVAALTVYDMCKALSHDIVIRETRLLEKRGGKSDVRIRGDKA